MSATAASPARIRLIIIPLPSSRYLREADPNLGGCPGAPPPATSRGMTDERWTYSFVEADRLRLVAAGPSEAVKFTVDLGEPRPELFEALADALRARGYSVTGP